MYCLVEIHPGYLFVDGTPSFGGIRRCLSLPVYEDVSKRSGVEWVHWPLALDCVDGVIFLARLIEAPFDSPSWPGCGIMLLLRAPLRMSTRRTTSRWLTQSLLSKPPERQT